MKKIRLNDGNRVEYQNEDGLAQIIIRKPCSDPNHKDFKSDYGFIHAMFKTIGKDVQIDNAGLDSDENIDYVFSNPETKIALVLNDKGFYDYVCFSYIDVLDEHRQLGYKHYRSLHGLVRSFKTDEFGTKITSTKYYKKVLKYNILTKILEEYFQDNDIISIDAWLPDFLKYRKVFKDKIDEKDKKERKYPDVIYKELPAHRLLKKAGFKVPFTPIRNYGLKNGRACDFFVYQLHRKFFEKINKDG